MKYAFKVIFVLLMSVLIAIASTKIYALFMPSKDGFGEIASVLGSLMLGGIAGLVVGLFSLKKLKDNHLGSATLVVLVLNIIAIGIILLTKPL